MMRIPDSKSLCTTLIMLLTGLAPACGGGGGNGTGQGGTDSTSASGTGTTSASSTGTTSATASASATATGTASASGSAGDTGATGSTATGGSGDTGTAGTATAGSTGGTASGGTASGGTATGGTATGGTTGGTATGGTTGGVELASWVLVVEDQAGGAHRLLRISIDPLDIGTVTEICPDITMPASIGQDTNITALTFNKSTLYASARKNINGDTLISIDPCLCTATEIGEYGTHYVNGITSNVDEKMLGLTAATDDILEIDVMTAMASVLNALPGNWGSHGLTWSDAMSNELYGIEATSDKLYTFDGNTGTTLGSVNLSMGFGIVGMEYHPGVQVLYACSDPGDLWSVDVATGTVTVEAIVGIEGCDNLAAPFGPVACVPQ